MTSEVPDISGVSPARLAKLLPVQLAWMWTERHGWQAHTTDHTWTIRRDLNMFVLTGGTLPRAESIERDTLDAAKATAQKLESAL